MKEYKLVIIDDNMPLGVKEPFARIIAKMNADADVSVFTDPSGGFRFIMNNLQSKMIVFLDCKFDEDDLQGIDVLRKIRERTSLVYVVMMSVNSLNGFSKEVLYEFINEEFISFYDRNKEPNSVTEIINKVKRLWTSRFDCVLENWIHRHPEDREKVVMHQHNESFTWDRILTELHQQTEVGKSFERMVHQFYIYQLPEK